MEKKQAGIINLDKPPGISSAAAVGRVKRMLERGTKIGHAGTLDPFATGVLLLLVGAATRRCEAMMAEPKTYEATLKLGATTATDDLESPEIAAEGFTIPTAEEFAAAAARFVGEIRQRPPIYSAMKVGGRRAYELARQGKPVELSERNVRIDRIEVLEFQWPLARIRVDCGRGTYIRALARDLGETLKTGAYLTALRRTRIGEFRIENAVKLEQLVADGIGKHLIAT